MLSYVLYYLLYIISTMGSCAFVTPNYGQALQNRAYVHKHQMMFPRPTSLHLIHRQRHKILSLKALSSDETSLALWTIAFASSHIGMSATRSSIISTLGEIMDTNFNLVGNDYQLPNWWPGDNTGKNRIFPDKLTAGRQLYRMLYTVVSFVTLGSAFGTYLQCSEVSVDISATTNPSVYNACLYTTALSLGAAIASLFNASPLGLMPSFEANLDSETITDVIKRDDAIKFTTRGLTRITRHPLILPVVPWGFATAYLMGGRTCDYIFFGGLSIYAICGCFAQDLRVVREEGSVGTTFVDQQDENFERLQLRRFFEETSFVPFGAVLDGRQYLDDILREAPWLQFVAGTIVGVFVEEQLIQLLQEWSAV